MQRIVGNVLYAVNEALTQLSVYFLYYVESLGPLCSLLIY